MIATFTWAITIISLTGTILNVKKNALCFWLWAFGNTAWLSYDLWLGLYSRAALDVVQLAFAIWGIVAWKKKNPLGVRGVRSRAVRRWLQKNLCGPHSF